ncbi:hypothetical protein ACVMGF_007413 [Bradyrhizobium diazoefficiens]
MYMPPCMMMPTLAVLRPHPLVQFVVPDEADSRGHPRLDLLLLMLIGRRRQHDAVDVPLGIVERVLDGVRRLDVVLAGEGAVHVTGADANLEHHRGVRDLGKLKTLLDQIDDAFMVGAGVEQPHLRFHREGMGALLHDGGAFAVVLADDDHGAAGDAARGQIGQRVGGDVGADGRLPRNRAAQGIHHRGREHRRRGRLVGGALEHDAEIVEHVLGVGEHVHQVRDRRALVAADIGDAGLQQCLGDGEDAFAAERIAVAEPEILDFASKRPFSHCTLQKYAIAYVYM